MPPLRTLVDQRYRRSGPRLQTPTPTVICAHFLRQIEANHVCTPSRVPIPLHFDAATQSLSEWAW